MSRSQIMKKSVNRNHFVLCQNSIALAHLNLIQSHLLVNLVQVILSAPEFTAASFGPAYSEQSRDFDAFGNWTYYFEDPRNDHLNSLLGHSRDCFLTNPRLIAR